MKRFIIASALAIAALAQPLSVNPAAAQAKKISSPIIAVVDVQTVMQNSEAAKGVRSQIDKTRNSYQATIHTKEEELKKLDQDLEQQRSILAPEAFQQKQRDFQQKVAAAQKDVQERSHKLETAFGGAMQKVQVAVIEIVNQISKEQGINLVLPKAAVLAAAPDMDLTAEVLRRLNAKLPSVAVTIPK